MRQEIEEYAMYVLDSIGRCDKKALLSFADRLKLKVDSANTIELDQFFIAVIEQQYDRMKNRYNPRAIHITTTALNDLIETSKSKQHIFDTWAIDTWVLLRK